MSTLVVGSEGASARGNVRVAQAQAFAARALWLMIVPAALAVLATRYLVPTPAEAQGTALLALARLAEAHALIVALVLFVLTSALVRYWRRSLPWGRLLDEATPPSGDRMHRALSFAVPVLAAAVAALLLRAVAVEPFHVTSASMLPTLAPGDEILANKSDYRRQPIPRRGDVIVFRRMRGLAEAAPDELVKRVIGLPGDRIAVKEGRVFINDWEIPRCDAGVYPHLTGDETTMGRLTVEFLEDRVYLTFITAFARPFAPYLVGPNEVFVMGDNRSNSADSRVWNRGRGAGVPLEAVEGRVTRLLASRGRDGRIDPGTLLRSLGLKVHLPGMDVRPLEEGVRKCLQAPPASTTPPAAPTSS